MNLLECLERTYGLANSRYSIFFKRDVILRNSNTTRKHKSRMAFTLNCPFSCIQLCRLSCWNTLDVCKFRKKFICKLQNVEFLCVPIPPFLWQHLKKQRTQVFLNTKWHVVEIGRDKGTIYPVFVCSKSIFFSMLKYMLCWKKYIPRLYLYFEMVHHSNSVACNSNQNAFERSCIILCNLLFFYLLKCQAFMLSAFTGNSFR